MELCNKAKPNKKRGKGMTVMANEPTAKQFKGLDADFIADLLGSSRTHNAYGPKLVEWIENSDEAGINPAEVWPTEFGKKLPSTLYQGFMNAVKKADLKDQVHVIKREDSVFLLHKERYNLLLADDTDTDTDEQ